MSQRVSFIVLLVLGSLATSAYGQDATQRGPQAAAVREAKRFGFGVVGGIGLDPEIVDVGAHATFGPLFKRDLVFRPGLEVGIGEITTVLNINLDFVYTFTGDREPSGLSPYIGVGPAFGLSHRGFSTDEADHVSTDTTTTTTSTTSEPNRFNFSDTDFNGGLNFIVGMRKTNGVFFEMRATAWGVSNIRLLAGFNF